MRIRLQEVTKYFDGTAVLNHLSLTLEEGEAYCLMAPSGAGKTTLFRILLGLLEPDSGVIEGIKESRFSAVFQEDRLLEPYSAIQNLKFVTGNRYSEQELEETAKAILPADSLKKPVSLYSGGMRRRLSVLRALLAPSDVLLMDEPFAGLDEETKEKTAAMIRRFSEGKTLLAATHDKEDAALLSAHIVHLDTCFRK